MAELACAKVRELSAELALGIADGHERAYALAHLERCADCRRDLGRLAEVVEALTELAPAAEPPAGFESRVVSALPLSTKPLASLHTRPPRSRPRAAAAVAAAAALTLGGFLVGRAVTRSPLPAPAKASVLTADFVSGRRDIGQVILSEGRESWLSVAVRTGFGTTRVRCELVGPDGDTVTVGTFLLDHGRGYWAAVVPPSWSSFATARLVSLSGRVLATADLSGTSHG